MRLRRCAQSNEPLNRSKELQWRHMSYNDCFVSGVRSEATIMTYNSSFETRRGEARRASMEELSDEATKQQSDELTRTRTFGNATYYGDETYKVN